jgi:tRNA-dihydrouridine synthase A
MVTTGALIHGDTHRHLHYHDSEHPIALQLGGSDPKALAKSVQLANNYQYDEVNLNCGCPSDRVQSGKFGAILMNEAQLVADCFKAMQEVSNVDVTIKHRIGIDEQDSYQFLCDFVGTVANSGCKTFIIHARKAWLKGLSPKQNRDIPPLDYDRVFQLKKDFPHLEVIINGGIHTLEDAEAMLQKVDGVMIGREAYHNPYLLAEVDQKIYHADRPPISRTEVLEQFCEVIAPELAKGTKLSHITRHILGLYQGIPGARRFRRYISENAHRAGADTNVIYQALEEMTQRQQIT